jgi:glycosyltransferase involved in cell wall biosynthesis
MPDRAGAAAGAPPAASVVVPAYDAASSIRRSLESLRRQTLAEPFEVIVVWSGDPATADIVRAEFPAVRLAGGQPRLSTGAARNLGIAAARADIIAFLAADCEADPEWLARRVGAHRQGHDLVGGAVVWAEPAGALARAAHLLEYNAFPPGRPRAVVATPVYNLSFRRAVFERFGGYDESLPCGEDTALIWSLVAAGMTFLFDPAIRIAHPSDETIAGFWRHQAWHGYWLGRISRRRSVPGVGGRGVRRTAARLVVAYPAARLWRLSRRLLAWQRDWALQALLLAPLLLLGLAAATTGLIRGLTCGEEAPENAGAIMPAAAGGRAATHRRAPTRA